MTETTVTEVPRDRWGKPLINVDGKLVAYYRASSFGDVLEDRSNLEKWKVRKTLETVAKRSDLYVKLISIVSKSIENKWELNKLAEELMAASDASDAADIGTMLHTLTEQIDTHGSVIGPVPPGYADDLAAYERGTSGFDMEHIEEFMVCDELGVAGTPDRLVRHAFTWDEHTGLHTEPLYVGDLKTGASSSFLDKHAVQLAIYAHSDLYDPATGEREAVDVAKDYGYIFHLPAGTGTFGLYKLDLEAGWEAALLAADVRKWRKRKGLAVPA